MVMNLKLNLYLMETLHDSTLTSETLKIITTNIDAKPKRKNEH